MSNLLETLERQHQMVLALAADLDGQLARSEIDGAVRTVAKMKTALTAHFALETRELYPPLVEAAERHREPQMLLVARSFQSNMERIAAGLVAFTARYAGPKVDGAALASDWARIKEILGQRIDAEESTLHPLYEKATRALSA